MPAARQFKFAISAEGERCEPVGKVIKQLATEHGWATVVREFCLTVEDFTERGKANRRNNEYMHAWLAAEVERHRFKHPKKKLAPALETAFPWDKPWWVFVGDNDKAFNDTDTVRKWHWRGQQLMKKDPKLAERWTRNLELAKEIIDTGWGRNLVKKRGGPKPAR
jgi:hypothetical protein